MWLRPPVVREKTLLRLHLCDGTAPLSDFYRQPFTMESVQPETFLHSHRFEDVLLKTTEDLLPTATYPYLVSHSLPANVTRIRFSVSAFVHISSQNVSREPQGLDPCMTASILRPLEPDVIQSPNVPDRRRLRVDQYAKDIKRNGWDFVAVSDADDGSSDIKIVSLESSGEAQTLEITWVRAAEGSIPDLRGIDDGTRFCLTLQRGDRIAVWINVKVCAYHPPLSVVFRTYDS